jgi:hypothetical protein
MPRMPGYREGDAMMGPLMRILPMTRCASGRERLFWTRFGIFTDIGHLPRRGMRRGAFIQNTRMRAARPVSARRERNGGRIEARGGIDWQDGQD